MKNPILVFTAVLALAGCTDALAPNVALGVYPLRTLDGNGEPFVIQDTTLASGERLVLSIADTFDFQSSSRTQHTEYTQTVFYDPDGTKDSVFAYISYPGAYRIQRDTIFVTYLPDFAP